MRSRYDEQLALLNRELTQMGAMCEEVISIAAEALADGGTKNKVRVASLENEIDQMERSVEGLCLKLILQQQPVARDLRQISAALKMITDMERIGDQALDIVEIIRFLNGRRGAESEVIGQMADAAMQMVTESVEAYVRQDMKMAGETIAKDDVVDDYFTQVRHLLIKMVAEKPEEGEYALDLLMIAKYFERIGDHAANIAEWVMFSVTGKHEKE